MTGDEKRRFCGDCQKHVHDLSAMTEREGRRLLRSAARRSICVRYRATSEGQIRFLEQPKPSPQVRALVVAAAGTAAVSGLMAMTSAGPVEPVESVDEIMTGKVLVPPPVEDSVEDSVEEDGPVFMGAPLLPRALPLEPER